MDGLFAAVNTGLVLAFFGLAGYLLAEWLVYGAPSWELISHTTRGA